MLSLGKDTKGKRLLPFRPDDTSGDRILVTKSYENMCRHLLYLHKDDKGTDKGAVLTGQPGVGASLRPDPHPVRQLTGTSVLQEKRPS